MDDQAETILCNLLRGAGLDGMAGMAVGTQHPLLAIRRAEARRVCEAVGLRWVDDPSNADPRHLRNRVRHELVPLCAAIARRDPVPVLARQATIARDEAALLDELSGEVVTDPTDARRLRGAPTPLARRAVRRWLREAGATRKGGGRGTDDRHPPAPRTSPGYSGWRPVPPGRPSSPEDDGSPEPEVT